jgi:holo-[acyl-carrier protein] synthase
LRIVQVRLLHLKVGTDICSIQRIRQVYERFGNKFMEKILTPNEIAYVLSNPKRIHETIAGRFAAKEATAKALGTGWRGIGWREIEVTRQLTGEPGLRLCGRAMKRAQALGIEQLTLSISHEREYAIAFVVAYGQ